MPRCAAFNWLQLALISVPALDSSYGSPGSGASCCCCYGCCGCRVMFCISLTRERQCGLRKRHCSAPTPPVPVTRLLLVLLHLAHYASSSSSFSCCRVQGLCIHLPLAWLVAGANILGSAHCSLSLSLFLCSAWNLFEQICKLLRFVPGQKLERGHLLRRPFTFDNCLVGIFLMGSDPVTPHHHPLALLLPCLDAVQLKSILHAGFFYGFRVDFAETAHKLATCIKTVSRRQCQRLYQIWPETAKVSGGFFSIPTRGTWGLEKLSLVFWVSLILKTASVWMKFLSFDLEGEFVLEFDQ